jgi:hypothetical protein
MLTRSKIILLTALTVMIHPLARSAFCQENQTSSQASQPEYKWMYGNVAQVGFAQGFILVFSDKGYINLKVLDNTTISIGPKKVGLESIKTEDSVRVQYYSPEPGKYIAVSISESKPENE